jgi:hypothetical protein
MRTSKRQFVRQQGFPESLASHPSYAALMLQPRAIAGIVALGVLLQSPRLFLILGVVLWWNALVPALNPFDAIYNRALAHPRRLPTLGPAPPPRRFAQGMAGTFALAIAVALARHVGTAAWALEAVFGAAVLALVVLRFCAGSYIYSLLWRRSRGGSGVTSDSTTSEGAGACQLC